MKIHLLDINNIKENDIINLYNLINDVYSDAESSLVNKKRKRIALPELKETIANEQLIVSELDNIIIGCVQVKKVNEDTLQFGMLVTNPAYKNRGIGGKLVSSVEDLARKQGCQFVCFELLTPKNWIHEQKLFLKNWYERLGYVKSQEVEFEHKEFLITECNFTLYSKHIF